MLSANKFILIILIAFFLTGCSLIESIPGFEQSQEEITLTYWGLWESDKILSSAITEYKKIKPNVNIVYEKRPHQQHREQLASQITEGKGPDIFRFHNTWTPMLESVLTPVPKDILSNADFRDNFYPTVISDLRNSEGKFIGIPLEIDGLGLYWNKDIFKAAGILKPPATWQELSQTAAKLTVKNSSGRIDTAGIALGTSSNVHHFSDILGLMILQNGGDPASPTDKETADTLEYYTNFAKGSNKVWDETMLNSTSAFAGEKVAMYIAPSWRAFEIRINNPLLNFDVAPVPQLAGSKVTWASYWAEGVSNRSVNQQEAWEFVKFLQKDDNLIAMYSEASKTPGRFFGEPYPKPSLASKIASDPVVGAFVQDAQFARSFPMASRTHDNGLNEQIIRAYENAVNAVLQGQSASKALETTAKSVSTTLNRFGVN